jgi:hypothetical protein
VKILPETLLPLAGVWLGRSRGLSWLWPIAVELRKAGALETPFLVTSDFLLNVQCSWRTDTLQRVFPKKTFVVTGISSHSCPGLISQKKDRWTILY